MNEVEARMRLAEVRARESNVRVANMRERASQLTENADIARAARARARAQVPLLRADVQTAEDTLEGRRRAAEAARLHLDTAQTAQIRAVAATRARVTADAEEAEAIKVYSQRNAKGQFLPKATTDALQANIAAATANRRALVQVEVDAHAEAAKHSIDKSTKRFEAATASFQAAEKRLRTAENAVETNAQRIARLGLVEGRMRGRAATVAERAVSFNEENLAAQEVARRYAARLAQNAQEHRVRAYNAVAATSERAGVVLGAGMAVATKVGSDFNQMLVTTGHNTSLTAQGLDVMNDTVKRLGVESGAPMDKLADGFRAVENRGYSAAGSIKILTPAMEAAVAKGSDLGVTTTLLANVMKEFFIPVERASDAMGMLVEISRRSGVNMEDMVHVFGQMTALSGNFGVSLAETGAAFVLFTRHGLNASQAAVQFRNDINKIINPTKKTKDAIADIFKNTGIDLRKYFSGAGLRAHGFSGLFGEQGAIVQAAARYKGGVSPSDISNKLFPSMRGQLGAAIATGTGAKEWAGILKGVEGAAASGTSLNNIYRESLNQINQQFERLKNSAIVAASSIASALTPDVRRATDNVNGLVAAFNNLDAPTKHSIAQFAVFASGTLILGGLIGKLVVGIGALNTAMIAMGAEGLVALAPLGIAFGLVAAAAGVLFYEYDRLAHAQERLAAQNRANAASTAASTLAAYVNGVAVNDLVGQYVRLHDNTHRTHDETTRMQGIMQRIAQMAPELVTGYNNVGQATGIAGDAAHTYAEHLLELEAAARRARAAVIDLQIAQETGAMRAASDAMRVSQHQLETHTLNITGDVERRTAGINLGGQWRPATAEEIRSHAPGLRTMPRGRLGDYFPFTAGRGIGPSLGTNYMMPQVATEQGVMQVPSRFGPPGSTIGVPATVPRRFAVQHPEMARVARELAQQNADRLAHEQALRDLAIQRAAAMQGPLVGGTPSGFDLAHAGAAGGSDVDKLAGIGDKAKKAKKEKESEAEREARRLQDKYQGLMEGYLQQQFLATHEGKAGEAMWETQAHGTVMLADGLHKVNGEFEGYNKRLRDQLVSEAKKADSQAASLRFEETRKNVELELFELQKNADKTARTPEQIAAKKAELGMYKGYGIHATDAMFTDIRLAKAKELSKAEEQVAKFREEANRPLEKALSVHDQMVKDIKAEAGAYALLGAAGTEALASQAQHNADAADALKLYTGEMEKATDEHRRLQLELSKDDTQVGSRLSEMQTEEYQKLNALQRVNLLIAARQLDVDRQRLEVQNATDAVRKSMAEQVQQARIDVVGAMDPAGQKWLEFRQKAVETYGKTWEKMSKVQQAAAVGEAQQAFDKISALSAWEATLHGVQDTMEAVSKGTQKLNDRVVMQAGDVEVTASRWAQLTAAQKEAVAKYAQMFDVSALVEQSIHGLVDLVGSMLDNLRQHGFRNFFRDIVDGFDNMLYEMSKKWLQSQILKLLSNVAGGLFGGGGGDLISFDPGPAVAGALASGGPVESGAAYLVGERGPELFRPSSSGRVVSNQEAFGGNTFVLHVHGVTDVTSFQASGHQIATSLGRMVAAAGRR